MKKKQGPLKICCYVEWTSGMDMETELRLMLKWRDNVIAFGHEPIVLNRYHAAQHPMFEKYNAYIETLPTVNDPIYEAACFRRWVACSVFAKNNGMIVMSDFDLFHTKPIDGLVKIGERLRGYQLNCPAFVSGTEDQFTQFMEHVLAGGHAPHSINGKDHFSDQYCFESWTGVDKVHIVKNYGETDWQKAPLVHLCHAALHPSGLVPRWKHVDPILKSLDTPPAQA